ncbi:MAG: hypothetical protein KDE25_13755 [Novosphingobium sp.]|nr:hypothetical protein [Novosphingobium sp.]
MSLSTSLLVPFALLLPTAEVVQTAAPVDEPEAASSQETVAAVDEQDQFASFTYLPVTFVVYQSPDRTAGQVRIEQTLRIRISPQRTAQTSQARPDMLVGVPQRAIGSSFDERRIGRCLTISSISGVQPNGGNDLILYLRDRRMVRAQLERSCRSREFYSGFYVAGGDGRLCVDRDTLQSRSGSNCKLAEIRQLVETGG